MQIPDSRRWENDLYNQVREHLPKGEETDNVISHIRLQILLQKILHPDLDIESKAALKSMVEHELSIISNLDNLSNVSDTDSLRTRFQRPFFLGKEGAGNIYSLTHDFRSRLKSASDLAKSEVIPDYEYSIEGQAFLWYIHHQLRNILSEEKLKLFEDFIRAMDTYFQAHARDPHTDSHSAAREECMAFISSLSQDEKVCVKDVLYWTYAYFDRLEKQAFGESKEASFVVSNELGQQSMKYSGGNNLQGKSDSGHAMTFATMLIAKKLGSFLR